MKLITSEISNLLLQRKFFGFYELMKQLAVEMALLLSVHTIEGHTTFCLRIAMNQMQLVKELQVEARLTMRSERAIRCS